MRDLSATDFEWAESGTVAFEAASVVDRHSTFDGNFRSDRDLRVEGELKGDVACGGTLFVAEGATVAAAIDAEHVTVAGDLNGEVRCRGRLQILPSGRVKAKVTTGTLVIQEGAIFEGQLEMAGIERSAPKPLRTRAAPALPGVEPVTADRPSGNGATFIRRLGSPEAAWESSASATDSPDPAEAANGEGSAS
jgi:cytoskeletal protein CcmA (bactofilin family)